MLETTEPQEHYDKQDMINPAEKNPRLGLEWFSVLGWFNLVRILLRI